MNPSLKLRYCLAIISDKTSDRYDEPCFRLSKKKNGYCGRHQDKVGSEFINNLKRKTFIVQKIKNVLAECDSAVGKSNKTKVCEGLFFFLLRCGNFLQQQDTFARTVYTKLIEFEDNEDYGKASKFRQIIFPNADKEPQYIRAQIKFKIQNIGHIDNNGYVGTNSLNKINNLMDAVMGHFQFVKNSNDLIKLISNKLKHCDKNIFDKKYQKIYDLINL